MNTLNIFFFPCIVAEDGGISVTWVRISAGVFKRFDLKSLSPHSVGVCDPNPRSKQTGALGKLLISHTA